MLATFGKHGPMTDEQLVERYSGEPKQSPSGLRTRRHELVELGEITFTGKRVRMKTNRLAQVWALA